VSLFAVVRATMELAMQVAKMLASFSWLDSNELLKKSGIATRGHFRESGKQFFSRNFGCTPSRA